MPVKFYLNMAKYTRKVGAVAAQLIAGDTRRFARQNVRIDTTRLRNSIRTDAVDDGFEVIAETPYALAQEFGRPDLPNYGYTPYMRPAAAEATTTANITKRVGQAAEAAKKASKI